VFLTLCHMLACSATSYAVAATRLVPLQPIKSRAQLGKIAVLAVVFCLTVVLGNVSLRYIPVSFNQAIGATTPAFTAALSFALMHARESRGTYLSLIPVVFGIIVASGAEPLFSLIGFMAAISATAGRAFKSVLQVRPLHSFSLFQPSCGAGARHQVPHMQQARPDAHRTPI
jgi:drug/metabolite transporter (DMT)-like permease